MRIALTRVRKHNYIVLIHLSERSKQHIGEGANKDHSLVSLVNCVDWRNWTVSRHIEYVWELQLATHILANFSYISVGISLNSELNKCSDDISLLRIDRIKFSAMDESFIEVKYKNRAD